LVGGVRCWEPWVFFHGKRVFRKRSSRAHGVGGKKSGSLDPNVPMLKPSGETERKKKHGGDLTLRRKSKEGIWQGDLSGL